MRSKSIAFSIQFIFCFGLLSFFNLNYQYLKSKSNSKSENVSCGDKKSRIKCNILMTLNPDDSLKMMKSSFLFAMNDTNNSTIFEDHHYKQNRILKQQEFHNNFTSMSLPFMFQGHDSKKCVYSSPIQETDIERLNSKYRSCDEDLPEALLLDIQLEKNRSFRCPGYQNALPVLVDKNLNIQSKCFDLFSRERMDSLERKHRIVFFVMAFNHYDFLKMLVKRLNADNQNTNHVIVIHVDMLVDDYFFKQVTEDLARVSVNTCVVQSGNIVYLTASEMRSIYSFQEWLLTQSGWDTFIPLTGKDYLLFHINDLEKLLENTGHKTWIEKKRGFVHTPSSHPTGDIECCPSHSTHNCPNFDRGNKYFSACMNKVSKEKYFDWSPSSNWLHSSIAGFDFCKSMPLFTGIFDRDFISFIHSDHTSQMIYAFWSVRGPAAVEHYYPSLIYNLIERELQPLNKFHFTKPCVMSWTRGRDGDGTHNTILTMDEWDIIEDAWESCIPIARKFNMDYSRELLDAIDTRLINSLCLR